jgi:hypothetical protein
MKLVQSDRLQINGHNASDTGFETIVLFQRLAAGNTDGIHLKQSPRLQNRPPRMEILPRNTAPTIWRSLHLRV